MSKLQGREQTQAKTDYQENINEGMILKREIFRVSKLILYIKRQILCYSNAILKCAYLWQNNIKH